MFVLTRLRAGRKTTLTEATVMGHYVEWKPFYSVGDAAMDEEHKRLLGMIDDLYEASRQKDGQQQFQGVLDRLVDYTMTHFEHEERLMRQCGFPNFDAHKMMHEEMRRRSFAFRDGAEAIKPRDLLEFLRGWWTRHIQNQDQGYSPYLDAIAPHLVGGK
jgi:hemerythrin-like metal-binding protein